ncbi:hypothetical protein FXO38_21785 [Capsicum annuum]|nr:hypothetical protein FXO38_21785 [Capsicum annuum]
MTPMPLIKGTKVVNHQVWPKPESPQVFKAPSNLPYSGLFNGMLKTTPPSELENLVESSQYNKSTSFNEVRKLIAETSEEVDKPRESKEDDNCVDMKLKKMEEEIEKMKEREKKWRSNVAKGTTKDNALFIIVFCCCVVVIATSYWFGMIYVKKDSIKLP